MCIPPINHHQLTLAQAARRTSPGRRHRSEAQTVFFLGNWCSHAMLVLQTWWSYAWCIYIYMCISIYISRCIYLDVYIYIYISVLIWYIVGVQCAGLQNNTRHGIIMMIMLIRANLGYGIHQDIQPSIDIWIQPGSTPQILLNQNLNVENWYGNKAPISASDTAMEKWLGHTGCKAQAAADLCRTSSDKITYPLLVLRCGCSGS